MKSEREVLAENREAYLATKDELLKKHEGEFAAFYQGKMAGVHSDKTTLIKKMRRKLGLVKVLICHITRDEPQIRLPTKRRLC